MVWICNIGISLEATQIKVGGYWGFEFFIHDEAWLIHIVFHKHNG